MRILIVSHSGGSPYHGPNMRSYYLALPLIDAGHEVQIVSSSYFHKYFKPPAVEGPVTHEIIDRIEYTWVRTRPYARRGVRQVINQVEFLLGCFKCRQDIVRSPPDVVVASSPHPLISYFARAVAREHRVPFVFEARDLWPLAIRELGGFSRLHPYIVALKRAEAYSVCNADLVVAIAPGFRDYFAEQYGLPFERFACVPNGFDARFWKEVPLPASITDALPRHEGFTIGYIGAVSTSYRLKEMIDAVSELSVEHPTLRFVVVGDGGDLPAIRRHISVKGIENTLTLGRVNVRYLPALLKCFDAGYIGLRSIAAHKYGISCNKIFEYFYAGLPILAAYTTDHDPVAAAGAGFTVRPDSTAQLVDGLQKLIHLTDKERRAMGEKGRAYFLAHHDAKVRARLYLEALQRAVMHARANSIDS